MADPEARFRIGDCDCLLLGTVAGSQDDGDRVQAAFAAFGPDAVALGIPPEDLRPLRALADDPALADDLPELDGADGHFITLLERFGPVTVAPSPDLAAAHAAARAKGIDVTAIDLDDDSHSQIYTATVKVRHLVQRSRAHSKLTDWDGGEATDRFDLAHRWDDRMGRVKPLRRLEEAREAVMAEGIRDLAGTHRRLLAVVPSTRLAGIAARLEATD